MLQKKIVLFIALFFVVAGLSSCARDYVTGKRTFNLVSEQQEVQMGKEADPQIIAEYGLYNDPKLAAYVDSVGQTLARVSQRPNLEYHYRLLDTPVVNAFALPGGYIYMTRGIMAYFNSEDEMAGVLGHETGHVVARHGAEQMSRAQLASIGLGVGSILSEDFRRFSGIAQTSLGLLFLKFSRGQESEADLLGVEYSTEVGYNAHKMAHFFNTIKRISEKSGQTLPTFLSTHPDPGNREVRVNELADEWQKKVKYQPKNLNPNKYLHRIDGIIYGDDPRQGFVEGNMFYHPTLKFQFPVPENWQVSNSASSVQMMNKEGTAAVQMSLGKSASPQQEADSFVANLKATVLRNENTRVHGLPAVVVESTVESQNGTLHVLSYFIQKDQNVYVFHGFTSPDLFADYKGTFASVMTGFDQLRSRAALEKKPERVRIKSAPQSADLKSVLIRLGMPNEKLEDLAILNGRELGDPIQSGELIKVIQE